MGTRSGNPLWKNSKSGNTPITAETLNKIEDALDEAVYPDSNGLLPESLIPTRLTEAALSSTLGPYVTAASASAAAALVSEHNAAATLAAAIPKALVDAKGDLLTGTANDTVGRLAAGANGGSLVADSAQASGLRWTTALRLEGIGTPEGVVTAPIGSTYTDSAATCGAVLWMKSAGAGNTGWSVASGDTGWRNVAADIGADWTMTGAEYLEIRRVGSTVEVRGKMLRAAAAGTRLNPLTIYTIPTGFKPARYVPRGSCYCSTAGSVGIIANMASVASIETRGMAGNWAANDSVVFSATWQTVEAWPTVLPGSAA